MYEITSLFWYKIIFMLELIFAEVLMSFRLKRRNMFALRVGICVIVCIGCAFAMPVLARNALWFSVMYLLMFAVTLVALKICFDESWVSVIFCGIAGYTTQHVAYQIFDFALVLMDVNRGQPVANTGSAVFLNFPVLYYGSGLSEISANPVILMLYAFVYGMTYFFCYLFTAKKLSKREDFKLNNITLLVLVTVILAFDIVLGAIVTYYSTNDYNRVYVILLGLYNIFCCLLALYLQFDVVLRRRLESDLETVNTLWRKDKQQYDLAKENINLINLKCHDLKHQIRKIGSQSALGRETIAEIENVISIYDSTVKTGNAALDVILTEKSLFCNGHNIRLSCIVDGDKLNFMSESDLYSLFGNLIDNAVEAVIDLDDDRKSIGLSVKTVDSFLSVNIHNYYDGEIEFDGQLPKTTKRDKNYHGYGMKSVQMLCQKYGGELSISAKNQVFNLNIVFPENAVTS